MKTKDLVVGKEYVIKRGRYGRPFNGICLSTETYVATGSVRSQALNGRVTVTRPANKILRERGGLVFAVRSWEGVWFPQVVYPVSIVALAEDYEAALAERAAQEQAEYERRNADAIRRNRLVELARYWNRVNQGWLQVALVARGFPPVKFDRWSNLAGVDLDFLREVIAKVDA